MTALVDHPWFAELLRNEDVAVLWTPQAQLALYRQFEAAYSRALGATGRVAPNVAERVAVIIETTPIDDAALIAGAAQDGLIIPALIRQLRAAVRADEQEAASHAPENNPATVSTADDERTTHEDHAAHDQRAAERAAHDERAAERAAHDQREGGSATAAVHVGATSQDVIDTALVLTLQRTTDVLTVQQARLSASVNELTRRFGSTKLMGRTRMQAALPIDAAHRMSAWAAALDEAGSALKRAGDAIGMLQLGGAVGDGHALGEHLRPVAEHMAAALGLRAPKRSWHTHRGRIVNYGAALCLLTGALGKMGQDVALMAQQGIDDIALAGGGGSSAMPHKRNPVEAELLVSLARFNASQLGGLGQTLVHEQERSGTAWTLEWMLLPEMAKAAGASTQLATRMLAKIERIGPPPAGSNQNGSPM